MKIGVFDSGVGGRSVTNAIQKALPQHTVILREDKQHLPYGNRSPQEILTFVRPILQQLVDEGCQVIVVACNTVSTTLAPKLKQAFSIPLVTMVPMIKPAAAQTKTGVIAVCATPTTLASPRYLELKETYAKSIRVLEPDCSDWALMIEHNAVDDAKIQTRITEVLAQKADVIVLGCTHYHWIQQKIQALAGTEAVVMQPEEAIIRRLKQVIAELAPQP